jgi:CRISPR/Cas system-associated exonuclease Cas4 (RecB family)
MALSNLIKTVNKVTKEGSNEMPHDVLFLKDFNEALIKVEQERQQPPPPDGYFRPSSMYGCERMLYYMRTGEPMDEESPDPVLIGICESGTDRHLRIQQVIAYMDKFGLPCKMLDVEQEVEKARARGINSQFMGWNSDHTEARCKNDDYRIYFQPDGIILYRNRKYILEIKTESTFAFSKRHSPKDDHEIQATCYSAGIGINNVLFFYEDRNFTTKKPFIVSVTDEMRARVMSKIQRVEKYVAAKIIPPMNEEKCTYCRYKTACKRDGETEEVFS